MKKKEAKAQRECANYFNGACTGVMFARHDGKLVYYIDDGFSGKPCIADSGECHYFNQIVLGETTLEEESRRNAKA